MLILNQEIFRISQQSLFRLLSWIHKWVDVSFQMKNPSHLQPHKNLKNTETVVHHLGYHQRKRTCFYYDQVQCRELLL